MHVGYMEVLGALWKNFRDTNLVRTSVLNETYNGKFFFIYNIFSKMKTFG